ncbi:cell division control protein 45 [Trichomonascus vanleenenianus]|uniref:DNA replication initiation factor CDC45 n=1 Tax=Trichomonascus vanleenenianus TaxID=2268995 RepID=UPI003ECA5744
MLSNQLKAEMIPHKTVPVAGYSELLSMYKTLDDDIVNVICFGCGAIVDLESYFEIISEDGQEASGRKIYVIDNHRPWNLDNLFGSTQVICFDDGSIDDTLNQHHEAYLHLLEVSEEDLEGSENDDSEEEDDETRSLDSIGSNDGRQREKDAAREGRRAERAKKRSEYERDTQLLENYYAQGTYLNASSTTQVYTLLSNVGGANIANLWLTVVGVTSLDNQYPLIYADMYPIIRDEVIRMCPPSNGNASDDNSLSIETDFSLFLLRHWTLYDSMIHSSYLSAKLQLWTEEGRKRLHKMLAKMGVSLQEAKEKWTHMHIPVKRTLKEKLSSVSGSYGIEEVIRNGVVRKYGFKGSLSAGDCVEALSALLQGPIDFSREQWDNPGEEIVQDTNGDHYKFWISNFFEAWDSLSSINKLLEAVDRAKELQKAIAATGTTLFEKRQIKDLRAFRLAVVRDDPILELYRNPLALARLGVWVAEGCAEMHSKPLPLVIAALDPTRDTYLVLGMGAFKSRSAELTAPSYESSYNSFGTAFQATATKINAQVKIDAFESSVIEVAKHDLARFLEALTLSGLV